MRNYEDNDIWDTYDENFTERELKENIRKNLIKYNRFETFGEENDDDSILANIL